MLDIRFIREHKDLVALAAQKKHVDFDVKELIELDDRRRELLALVEKKRAAQNAANGTIANASNADERTRLIDSMKKIKAELDEEEGRLKHIMKEWQSLMLRVPNIPDISVPEGSSDRDNKEVKVWGEKPTFSYTPKDHVEIMTALNMLDLERGVKVHGFRGYFLKGQGVRLCFAIWNYALDFFSGRGYLPIMPPTLVRSINLYGTGYLPHGAEDLYTTQDGDYLAGTAEVPLMGLHSDEILTLDELPKKYIGFSPCYRREAGAHGKDVHGLIRVNEFYKFEQLILSEAHHETSVKLHEEIQRNTEEFIETLGIPYQTVVNCGGDLGLGQVKKYDINLWVPRENTYREISSASYFHDFQCRRLNIRYRDREGVVHYAHSLNATAIPTPRILVSLVENFQTAEGGIRLPTALVEYYGNHEIR